MKDSRLREVFYIFYLYINNDCFSKLYEMSSEQLCLKWNNFESNIASFLDILRNGNEFVDVTITCENTNFKAHKLILSACSPYFKGIFQVRVKRVIVGF